MDRSELKETFHRVNAYRHVCQAVRGSAGHSFFSGCIFTFIAFLTYQFLGSSHPIFLVQAGLALLEFAIFFWKKFGPSVECVLADSLVNLSFGGSILVRQLLVWQKVLPGAIHPISLFIGCWALYDAWNQFQAYIQLRRAFVVRPTRTQMSYVAEMEADIRDGDPATDPTALALDADPRMRALLADEIAFLVIMHTGDTLVVDRDALTITKTVDAQGETDWLLRLEGQPFELRSLSEANWRNYCRWKGEPA